MGTNVIKYWTNDLNSVCSVGNIQTDKLQSPGLADRLLSTDSNSVLTWINKSDI